MGYQLVALGIGGQGILFASRVLERAAIALGLDVLGSETHGMSQRGGSVASHLKTGGFRSPLVRKGAADCLLGLSPDEACRGAGYLRPGGLAVVNATGRQIFQREAVFGRWRELGADVWVVDADVVAMALRSPRLANVAILGAAAAHPSFLFGIGDLRGAVAGASPEALRTANLQALEIGHSFGRSLSARGGIS